MGLFDRFRRLIRSNLNDMISKAENPEKVLDQLLSDMNRQLIDAKKSVASAIADERKLKRRVDESLEQAEEWEEKAALALRNNREDLAREALLKKQELAQHAEEYKKQWQSQVESVDRLKISLRGLEQKREEAQRKRNMLVARARSAEARRQMQQTLRSQSDTSAFDAFDKLSARLDEIEAENDAFEELEGSSQSDSLEREFAKLEGASSDSEKLLEELRKKLALEDRSAQSTRGGGSVSGQGETEDVDEELEAIKRKLRDEVQEESVRKEQTQEESQGDG